MSAGGNGRRLRRTAARGLLLAALGGAGALAHAGWLTNEWRSFRSYPRLAEANRLFEQHRYEEARRYVDEAERVEPDNVGTATMKFTICEQQGDMDCIRALASRWQTRKPGSGLGPAMAAYVASVEGRHDEADSLAKRALSLSDLPQDARGSLGRGWIDSLLRRRKFDEAAEALVWLDANRVPVDPAHRNTWQSAIAAGKASPPDTSPPAVAKAAPAPAAPKGKSARGDASPPVPRAAASPPVASAPAPSPAPAPSLAPAPSRPSPAARAAPRAPSPAPAPVAVAAPPPPPAPPPEAEVLDLIRQARYADAVARIQSLDREGRLNAQVREGLVLNLQAHDCAGVQQLVPATADAPRTTVRQQLAAGYCSQRDPALALRHFQAARQLAGDGQPAVAAEALAGQADAQTALGDERGALQSLGEAVRLAPGNPQVHAAYGFRLKANGEPAQAKDEFAQALRLDSQRTELLPELAQLAHDQNEPAQAIEWGRGAIDQQASVAQRLQLDDDEAKRRLFGWRRAVQTEEDRFGWYASVKTRLDHGPDGARATSPVDYAQYNGTVDIGASYRFTPIDAQLPTWAFARASQGLDDRSLSLTPDSQLVGAGVRQRLTKDYLVVASAEYLWRQSAPYQDDAMLRLSASHTWGGDWDPVSRSWMYANLYGDLAWLVRQRSHYVTLQGDWGRAFAIPDLPFKGALMPYLTSGYSASNDGVGRVEVTRLDVGVGLALVGWHWEDTYRAPAIKQRLALEYRGVIGGNAQDRQTVQLTWTILH